MISIYEKDLTKLKIILIVAIIASITLVGYSYGYTLEKETKDVSIRTIYNTGRNSCILNNNDFYSDSEGLIKGIECRFTVMGENNTNEDLNYKIVLKNSENNNINGEFVKVLLMNKERNLEIGPFNGKVLDNSLEEEIKIIKNSQFNDEYVIKMWLSKEELLNNNWYDTLNGKFLIKIDVIY